MQRGSVWRAAFTRLSGFFLSLTFLHVLLDVGGGVFDRGSTSLHVTARAADCVAGRKQPKGQEARGDWENFHE